MAISPRIRKAIEESMDRLPEDVRWAVEDFAQGVMAGRAPNLERHTRELYKAFAPLRAALPGEVTVYRGEPKNPPKIKRKWLSWSPSATMAAQFGIGTGKHIVEAAVSSKDVIAGILSPHNENYIEYLVWDRPQYHEKGTENPHVYVLSRDWGTYEWTQELHEDESWLEASVRDIERLGGKVLRVRKYDPDEDFAPKITFVLPSGASLDSLERDTYDVYDMGEAPRYYGKLATSIHPMASRIAARALAASATPTQVDELLAANEELPETIGNEDFDEVAETLEPVAEELARGDFSLVLDLGNKVMKVMTDPQEAAVLKKIGVSKLPTLPKVYEVKNSRYFNLSYAVIKNYDDLPARWKKALRGFIQFEEFDDPEVDIPEIATEYGVGVDEARHFFEALDWLADRGIRLSDWKEANVMWDPQEKAPVLVDLGEQ